MSSCDDYIAGDERARGAFEWSTDEAGDDSDGGEGVREGVILYWYICLWVFGIIGAGWVLQGVKGNLGVDVPVGEGWGL